MVKKVSTDVDIDVFGRDMILSGLECVDARIDRANGKIEKHPTGVYFQNIPRDPVTNICTLDHKVASEYGYFKIDFLNVNMYEGIVNESHLRTLMDREPLWEFFEIQEITDQLFHLNNYSHLLKRYKPQCVEDLAMILAIIRPSKAYLQQYGWDKVRAEVWAKNEGDESYQFKRSHGIAYALAIIVNLNLLVEKMSKS
jgi:DNA polymerase III alpha subunit